MPRKSKKNKPLVSSAKASKYDAHHKVINSTYGDFADLRHQLSESKEDVAERSKLLEIFATCNDSQRSWLLLEDYFNKLKLSRKDFPGDEWWDAVAKAKGKKRQAARQIETRGGRLINVDAMLIAEAPKIAPHVDAMKANIATALGVPAAAIGIKATTTETMGFVGRGEGMAAHAVASVELPE